MGARRQFTRGVIGYPTVLLAIAWFGIWLLWPQVTAPRQPKLRLPKPRIGFTRLQSEDVIAYKRPTLFARSADGDFAAFTDQDPAIASFVRVHRPTQPVYLEFPAIRHAQEDGTAAFILEPPAQPALRRWYPDLQQPAPPKAREASWKLLVEPASSLKECGFRIPDAMAERLAALGKAFALVARVAINASGRVEEVFLEDRTDDLEINRAVLGALERGMVSSVGRPCRGRIVVSLNR